jgi:hypothetical protein
LGNPVDETAFEMVRSVKPDMPDLGGAEEDTKPQAAPQSNKAEAVDDNDYDDDDGDDEQDDLPGEAPRPANAAEARPTPANSVNTGAPSSDADQGVAPAARRRRRGGRRRSGFHGGPAT